MSTSQPNETEAKLLEELQRGFPFSPRPFLELGQALGLGEMECLDQVRGLKERGILRSIEGIFENEALGYHSTLVGLKLASQKLDEAANHIGQHPGVSHNYAREGDYNLWFTLTLSREEDLKQAAERLAKEVGAQDMLYLPALRIFKIRTFFSPSGSPPPDSLKSSHVRKPQKLSSHEIAVVKRLQQDLPLEVEPFQSLSEGMDIDQAEFLLLAEGLQKAGVMRRYAGLVHHRRLGFSANGMGCWEAPAPRIEEIGQTLARSPWVSHCYQRLSYRRWPYDIYTMLHAATREECHAYARSLSKEVGVNHYALLFSTKEYKQQRVRHFR